MKKEKLKASVITAVDAHQEKLAELSAEIHGNPETGFQEIKASGWLTDYLKENGFRVETGICELPTSFIARYGKGRPVIALIAEYDALPGLGHACGHNLIGTSAVGAAVAVKEVVDTCQGSIWVVGTPAEELYGGKITMVERGAFADVDLAMMVHPGGANTATTSFLACQTLDVIFLGKAAHAAASPEEGINALEAMLLSFAGINSLRQHIKDKARIHGVITEGGEAPNIVPARSAGSFIVRAEEDVYLQELKEKVLNCFKGAASATGATLEYRWGEVTYAALRNNMTLARLFRGNMQLLGRKMHLHDPKRGFGSSDMGNVSQLVPGIHPTVTISSSGVLLHSPEFARAAASETGLKGMLDAAKAMAMTVVDLLANPDVFHEVREEFNFGKKAK
ncbi:M20 family metallopeptidase [Chloroflexota bacterium]